MKLTIVLTVLLFMLAFQSPVKAQFGDSGGPVGWWADGMVKEVKSEWRFLECVGEFGYHKVCYELAKELTKKVDGGGSSGTTPTGSWISWADGKAKVVKAEWTFMECIGELGFHEKCHELAKELTIRVDGGQSRLDSFEATELELWYSSLGGDGWNNKDGWSSDEVSCESYGITCDASGSNVIGIDLNNNNLIGSYRPDLTEFEHLTDISLYGNKLSFNFWGDESDFPTTLNILSVYNNQITGTPVCPDTWEGKYILYANDNKLVGFLTETMCNLGNNCDMTAIV